MFILHCTKSVKRRGDAPAATHGTVTEGELTKETNAPGHPQQDISFREAKLNGTPVPGPVAGLIWNLDEGSSIPNTVLGTLSAD